MENDAYDALGSEQGIDSLNISNVAKVKCNNVLKGSNKLFKAIELSSKIEEVAAVTGQTPEAVFETAKKHAGITDIAPREVGEEEGEPDSDFLYSAAVDIIKEKGKVSTSLIQRHLKIGYNRAALIIEEMEKNGIISPASDMGKRNILVAQDEKSEPDSAIVKEQACEVGGVAGDRLLSFIERIERLNEEKEALCEDIKEVYGEAKGVGFDVPTIRLIIRLRKIEIEKRREMSVMLDLYADAIGMQGILPL